MDGKWIKLYQSILYVLRSNILTLIVRYTNRDPKWENQYIVPRSVFADAYLNSIIKISHQVLATIRAKKETNMIKELENKIFERSYCPLGQHYTVLESGSFIAEGYTGFTQACAFEYILTFLSKYFESINELCNVFFLKGAWFAREFSLELSENIQELALNFKALSEFDKSLSETGTRGSKIKDAAVKSAASSRYTESLNKYFRKVNDEARELIKKSVTSLSLLIVSLNALNMERTNPLKSLISNWEEVESIMRSQNIDMVEVIQRVDDLIKLLQYVDSLESKKEDFDFIDFIDNGGI